MDMKEQKLAPSQPNLGPGGELRVDLRLLKGVQTDMNIPVLI